MVINLFPASVQPAPGTYSAKSHRPAHTPQLWADICWAASERMSARSLFFIIVYGIKS